MPHLINSTRIITAIAFGSLSISLVSCIAIRVNYDYDKSTDFTNYSTYNYYPDLNTGLSQLDAKRLLDAVDSVMQVKGYLLSEESDFLINIQSHAYASPQSSAVGVGVGGTGGNVGGGISVGLPIGQQKLDREIIFDLVDSQKDELFWQAVTNSDYSENATPLVREEKLKAVVVKAFSKFPPSK